MATATIDEGTENRPTATVDPRAPRFGQAVTATLLGAGALADLPALVYVVAAVLGLAALSGWRLDAYGAVWKRAMVPLVGPPDEREAAAPHRFAKLMGAAGSAGASALLLAGFPVPGYLLAGGVAALAGLAAVTGICVGCRLYRGVSLFRRLGVV